MWWCIESLFLCLCIAFVTVCVTVTDCVLWNDVTISQVARFWSSVNIVTESRKWSHVKDSQIRNFYVTIIRTGGCHFDCRFFNFFFLFLITRIQVKKSYSLSLRIAFLSRLNFLCIRPGLIQSRTKSNQRNKRILKTMKSRRLIQSKSSEIRSRKFRKSVFERSTKNRDQGRGSRSDDSYIDDHLDWVSFLPRLSQPWSVHRWLLFCFV